MIGNRGPGDDRDQDAGATNGDADVRDAARDAAHDADAALDRAWNRTRSLLFGDRRGFALWLGLVLVYGAAWRIGIGSVITDTNAVANAVVAVADGHFAVRELRYPLDTLASDRVQQGLVERAGRTYARDYGLAVAAVPLVWLLEGLTGLADVRALIAGAWSLGILAFASQVGRLWGRRRPAELVGAGLAVVALVANLATASFVDPRLLPVVALQLTTLLAAAWIGVAVYRLVSPTEGPTVGLAAGLATGLASPVTFWASVPKRHVPVAALLLGATLAFAASRRRSPDVAGDDGRRATAGDDAYSRATGATGPVLRWRALAYAAAGLVTWVHAYDGLLVVAAVVAVDLATAGVTDRRTAGALAGALGVALLPTLLTNLAVTGSPLELPRHLPALTAGPVVEVARAVGAGPTTSGPAVPGPTVSGSTVAGLLQSPLPAGPLALPVGWALGHLQRSLATLADPGLLWHVFVRSGKLPGVDYAPVHYRIAELTVLESAPLLGALAGAPLAALAGALARSSAVVDGVVARIRRPLDPPSPAAFVRSATAVRRLSPARQVDLLAVVLGTAFVVAYVGRLPLHAQYTVRYLFPLYPLGIYGVARLGPVAAAVGARPRRAAASFAVTGTASPLVVLALAAALDLATGEAVQLQALVHLGAATALAAAVAGGIRWPDRVPAGATATLLGAAAGLSAGYYALVALEYFRYGTFALGGVGRLADLVAVG